MSPSRPLPPPGGEKLLLGVVHLPPLPGAPRYDGRGLAPIVEHARADAEAILDAGMHGFVVENFGDAPFFKGAVPPVVVAGMTALLERLGVEGACVGVNVLRNDAASALAIAAVTGAAFVRVNVHVGAMVTDQGVIEGRAAETLRLRAALGANVAVLADVDVKHARPLGGPTDLVESTRETIGRGLADGVIVTGRATGAPVDLEDLRRVRGAAGDHLVLAGSGATERNASEILAVADGVIVGTSLKRGGDVHAPVDPVRAAAFVRAALGDTPIRG